MKPDGLVGRHRAITPFETLGEATVTFVGIQTHFQGKPDRHVPGRILRVIQMALMRSPRPFIDILMLEHAPPELGCNPSPRHEGRILLRFEPCTHTRILLLSTVIHECYPFSRNEMHSGENGKMTTGRKHVRTGLV